MNFIKRRRIFFTISITLIILSLVSLFSLGLKPGISFTGGSSLELEILSQEPLTAADVQQTLAADYELEEVRSVSQQRFVLKGEQLTIDQKQEILDQLSSLGEVQEIRFEIVGPALGRDLIIKTGAALLIISLITILYLRLRFKEIKYGVCAVLGMLHDSIILIGSFSLFGYLFGAKIDSLFLAALLTTLSFSIHDTVVIYDRLRELIQEHKFLNFKQAANLVIWETLVRSVNNSLTIIIMLLALIVLAGVELRWFALALLVGTAAGTYSSTFVTVPLLIVWDKINKSRK